MANQPLAVKVMSADRSVRKGIVSSDFEDLMKKCREKFNITGDEKIRLVLEKDGFEIDSDFYLNLSHMTQLMLLAGSEVWVRTTGIQTETSLSNDETTGSNKPSLLDIVAKIRNKQTSLFQSTRKRPRCKLKIKIGWMVWVEGKYIQIRKRTGGGVFPLDFTGDDTILEVLQKGKDIFFPSGQNSWKGKVEDYEHTIGDYKQNQLSVDTRIDHYISLTNQPYAPRLYLLSRKHEGDEFDLKDVEVTSGEPDVQFLIDMMDENPCEMPLNMPNEELVQSALDDPVEGVQRNSQAIPLSSSVSVSEDPLNAEVVHDAENDQMILPNSFVSDITGNRCLRLGRRRAALRCRRVIANSLQRHLPRNTDPLNRSRSMETIEIIDSEDEELQKALLESINQNTNTRSREPETKLPDILKKFQGMVNTNEKQEIIISRKNVLDSAFRALNRKFSTGCNLYVKFSGEMGLDHGGPRREFFRLVLKDLCFSSIFEGPTTHKFFRHDVKKLERKEYFMVGQLLAMSLLHEGPGLHILNESLVNLMLEVDPKLEFFDTNQLPDEDVKDILSQLKAVDNEGQKDKFLSDHGDWLITQGYTSAWSVKLEECPKVIKYLIQQLIYYRTLPEIYQFTSGMDEVLGLWSILKASPKACIAILCEQQTNLTKDIFMTLFIMKWSIEGSNKRTQEEDTIYSWEVFLQDIQDNIVDVTFEELLIFISGADRIPPCGFHAPFFIEFYTNEGTEQRLPFASTCALTLSLPRGVANPDNLKRHLMMSLKDSYGFGKM